MLSKRAAKIPLAYSENTSPRDDFWNVAAAAEGWIAFKDSIEDGAEEDHKK